MVCTVTTDEPEDVEFGGELKLLQEIVVVSREIRRAIDTFA
jgi:hypothetical protein